MYFDLGQSAKRTQGTKGNVVVLLGQSERGAPFEPILPSSIADARRRFGIEGSLFAHYEAAKTTFPTVDFILVRTNGTRAVHSIELDSIILDIHSTSAGEAQNTIRLWSDEHTLTIRDAFGKRHTLPLYKHSSLAALCQETEQRAVQNNFPVFFTLRKAPHTSFDVMQPWMTQSPNVLQNLSEQSLSGGTDGWSETPDDIYMQLEQAYSLLEGFHCEAIVPLDAYFNTPSLSSYYGEAVYGDSHYVMNLPPITLAEPATGYPCSFHRQLLEFIRYQRSNGIVTHGIMNLSPVTDAVTVNHLPDILKHLDVFSSRDSYSFDFAGGSPIDEGGQLTITAQGLRSPQGQWLGAAALYAGVWVQNHLSLTNAPLPFEGRLVPEFTGETAHQLSEMGVVSFVHSGRRGYVVAYGITAAALESDWRQAENIRAVQRTLYHMNRILDSMLGAPLTDAVSERTVEEKLNDALDELVQANVLRDASARVPPNSSYVELRYTPRNSMRELTTLTAFGGDR